MTRHWRVLAAAEGEYARIPHMGLWEATKNLPNIILPRRGQRAYVRQWQSLADWANRELREGNEDFNYVQALENVRMMAVVMACVGWVAVMLPTLPLDAGNAQTGCMGAGP